MAHLGHHRGVTESQEKLRNSNYILSGYDCFHQGNIAEEEVCVYL